MKGLDDIILSWISFPFAYGQYLSKTDSDVKITILYNKSSNKVVFTAVHWTGSLMLYKSLINKLKDNYTVIICRLPHRRLSENIKNAPRYFNKAKKNIIHIIQTTNYLGKNGYEQFSSIGFSLSSCLVFMIANSDKRFQKIMAILPGSDLAKCFCESTSLVA